MRSRPTVWFALLLLALGGRLSGAQNAVSRSQNAFYCINGYSSLCDRSLLTAQERFEADAASARRDSDHCLVVLSRACTLDRNGNFESRREQDAFIAATMKTLAVEMNSQAPVQLDDDTRMMSVLALQKTITFNMRLPKYSSSQVDATSIAQVARENLNHTVCKSKATRELIALGVQYVYLYSGNDGKLITRVVIDSYRC
jgi:hypothetical protein